jgi:hypothetical protein
MDDEFLKQARQHTFAGEDANLYQHIGYFCTWFGQVELQITFLMALLNNSPDFVGFDLLIKGMDARVKIERLTKLLKLRAAYEKKSNLGQRLIHFETLIVPLRNRIMHSGFYSTHDPESVLHLTSLTKFPAGGPIPNPIPDTEDADSITYLRLFKAGLWLNYFNDDLTSIYKGIPQSERVFEIKTPRTWVPTEYLGSRRPKAGPSKDHKPSQNGQA